MIFPMLWTRSIRATCLEMTEMNSLPIIVALSAVAALCAFAVIYPYLIYPIILACLPRRAVARGAADGGDGSHFSLLFCAYNEAASMPSKLANLKELKARYPALEVLAFDDGSTDGTADLIATETPFVRLLRGGGRNGKAHGMKLLAEMAQNELLIFTDANVLLQSNAPDALASCYADPDVGGVCGALHYLGQEGTATAAVGGMYWRLEERIKDLESSTGSVMGADGSIFSIRAELYPEFPDTVLDDFTVSMEVVFQGKRLIKSNDVIAFEQLVSSRSDEFARKVRIAARAFHTHTTLAEKRATLSISDRFRYLSHKTLRWFGGAFLVAGAISGLLALLFVDLWLGSAAVAVLICVSWLGVRFSRGSFSAVIEIVLAMIATMMGVVKALRGLTFATWNPAKSRAP